MLIPQSACYNVLRDRLVSTSRFRQSVIANNSHDDEQNLSKETEVFVSRVLSVRSMHCRTVWETIRAESLESMPSHDKILEKTENDEPTREEGADRRAWLGYVSVEDENETKAKLKDENQNDFADFDGVTIEEVGGKYNEFPSYPQGAAKELFPNDGPTVTTKVADKAISNPSPTDEMKGYDDQEDEWKAFWSN